MGRAKNGRNKAGTGDFIFENYKEQDSDKYEEKALELMCRHFEFYGQLNSPDIEYVTRGAKLSCTHGNRYIYLDAARDHGVYDGKNPVLTCKDCKKEENIKDFGACGNGKFEPLYSEEAPHPAQTALNRNGQERYVCLPVLLGEWGYGDINSRSLLIGEVLIDKAYKVYKKESFNYPIEASVYFWGVVEKTGEKSLNAYVAKYGASEGIFLITQYFTNSFVEGINPALESIRKGGAYTIDIEKKQLIVNGQSFALPNGWDDRVKAWRKVYEQMQKSE